MVLTTNSSVNQFLDADSVQAGRDKASENPVLSFAVAKNGSYEGVEKVPGLLVVAHKDWRPVRIEKTDAGIFNIQTLILASWENSENQESSLPDIVEDEASSEFLAQDEETKMKVDQVIASSFRSSAQRILVVPFSNPFPVPHPTIPLPKGPTFDLDGFLDTLERPEYARVPPTPFQPIKIDIDFGIIKPPYLPPFDAIDLLPASEPLSRDWIALGDAGNAKAYYKHFDESLAVYLQIILKRMLDGQNIMWPIKVNLIKSEYQSAPGFDAAGKKIWQPIEKTPVVFATIVLDAKGSILSPRGLAVATVSLNKSEGDLRLRSWGTLNDDDFDPPQIKAEDDEVVFTRSTRLQTVSRRLSDEDERSLRNIIFGPEGQCITEEKLDPKK